MRSSNGGRFSLDDRVCCLWTQFLNSSWENYTLLSDISSICVPRKAARGRPVVGFYLPLRFRQDRKGSTTIVIFWMMYGWHLMADVPPGASLGGVSRWMMSEFARPRLITDKLFSLELWIRMRPARRVYRGRRQFIENWIHYFAWNPLERDYGSMKHLSCVTLELRPVQRSRLFAGTRSFESPTKLLSFFFKHNMIFKKEWPIYIDRSLARVWIDDEG